MLANEAGHFLNAKQQVHLLVRLLFKLLHLYFRIQVDLFC